MTKFLLASLALGFITHAASAQFVVERVVHVYPQPTVVAEQPVFVESVVAEPVVVQPVIRQRVVQRAVVPRPIAVRPIPVRAVPVVRSIPVVRPIRVRPVAVVARPAAYVRVLPRIPRPPLAARRLMW